MSKEKSKSVHAGHRERVRKRYLSEGLTNFEEHQILEMLLFYAYPQRDTNDIAHEILNGFGTLRRLLEADPLEIMEKCKVTENVATFISIFLPVSRAYLMGEMPKGTQIETIQDAVKLAKAVFFGEKDEAFYMLCLNIKRRLICNVLIAKGRMDEVAIYPQTLIREALLNRAHSVIISHNHPSGDLRPSKADLDSTKSIYNALHASGIELLDHIIIAGDNYYSFSERGKLDTAY